MNLLIDLSGDEIMGVNELESMQDINEITFIVPVFLFFQNNFKLLINYIAYLYQHPLTKTTIHPVISQEEIKQLEQHNVVLVRGTFDHLHLGHQVLLMKAIYSATHKLIVQIKDDSIVGNKLYKQLIQPVQVRRENVKKFLQGLKQELQIKIQIITEVYGSAPYTKAIDAIAISQESIHSLNHINKLRKSNNGFKKVQMIISPLMTIVDQWNVGMRQQRIDGKLSSLRIREYLLKENNFTIEEYLSFRAVWDSLVKEINSLCRVKDIDFIVVEKWWQRIVYQHTISRKNASSHLSSPSKTNRKSNKQIFEQIRLSSNRSTETNEQSLKQIGISLGLLMQGVGDEEKSVNGVVRVFLQGLLKKKGKTKSCKKIRRMLNNYIKEFVVLKSANGEKRKSLLMEQAIEVNEKDDEQLLITDQQQSLLQGELFNNQQAGAQSIINIHAADNLHTVNITTHNMKVTQKQL